MKTAHLSFFALFLVSIMALALPLSAFAVDIATTSKYLCRVEEGKSPSLVKAGTLKAASFSTVLKQLGDKITAAKANVDRIAKTGNKGKLAAAKAKLNAAKADKKKVQECKSGKLTGSSTPNPTPAPTPNNSDPNKVAGTFEERFGSFTDSSGTLRCAFFTFFKWPAAAGAVYNKITFDHKVNSPPVQPIVRDVAPPYEDIYIYRGISGTQDTGISFTVDAGFHWVQFGRYATFGDDCTDEALKAEVTAHRAASNANGFAYRAN